MDRTSAATGGPPGRGWMPWLPDVLLACVVTLVTLASFIRRFAEVVETDAGPVRFAPPNALGAGLVMLAAAPLIWRRQRPWAVLLVTSAAAYTHHALGYAPPPLPYGPMLALFSLAVLRKPIQSLIASGVAMLGIVALYRTSHSPVTDDEFLTDLLAFGAAWALGYGLQLNHTRADLLERQAAQLAREQATNARLAIEQERGRIARELHDIISDRVVVMVAQAAATRSAIAAQTTPDPGLGVSALRSIEELGRDALAQTRRLLGLLQPEPLQEVSSRGLADLPQLVAELGGAGLTVELAVRGAASQLPAEVDATAYRIIHEALANVLKYASPAWAEVAVGYQPRVVTVTIHDLGTLQGQAGTAGHHGLAGVVHRVVQLGGRLVVGPRPHRGFEVHVELPLDGARL